MRIVLIVRFRSDWGQPQRPESQLRGRLATQLVDEILERVELEIEPAGAG